MNVVMDGMVRLWLACAFLCWLRTSPLSFPPPHPLLFLLAVHNWKHRGGMYSSRLDVHGVLRAGPVCSSPEESTSAACVRFPGRVHHHFVPGRHSARALGCHGCRCDCVSSGEHTSTEVRGPEWVGDVLLRVRLRSPSLAAWALGVMCMRACVCVCRKAIAALDTPVCCSIMLFSCPAMALFVAPPTPPLAALRFLQVDRILCSGCHRCPCWVGHHDQLRVLS